MSMHYYPFFHLNAKPKRIYANRYNGEKQPLNIIAEQLNPRAVKRKSATVYYGMSGNPPLFVTNHPRHRNGKRNERN